MIQTFEVIIIRQCLHMDVPSSEALVDILPFHASLAVCRIALSHLPADLHADVDKLIVTSLVALYQFATVPMQQGTQAWAPPHSTPFEP